MTMTSSDTANDPLLDSIAELSTRPTKELDHLPGDYGMPVFGNSFSILKNARAFNRRMVAKFGTVYRSSAFFSRVVVFADADAAQYALMDKEQNFSSSKGWFMLKHLLPGGILVRDFANHRKHRRPLQLAFKSQVMAAYGDRLNKLIKEGLEEWPTDKQFLFQDHIKSLLLDNAATVFLGAELGEESKKLNQAFVDLIGGIVIFIHKRIPGTKFDRAMRGSEYLKNWLHERIDERRNSSATDIFTSLCHLADDPENGMSAEDVVGHTLLILFAAHDTTTSTLSTMMAVMAEHPQWQEAVREEMLAVEGDSLSFQQVAALPVTDRVFRETLRCFPAVFMIPRRSIRAFEYQGHKIPANTLIHVGVDQIHRSEKYWSKPDQFDPDRWLPERAENKGHPFQWIPFGGGAHKCLGFKFADMQVKIFLFHLLRNYKIEAKKGKKFSVDLLPIPLPSDKLPVTMTRLR
ncbi:MAG: cytochrome P450 [Pseudomonadales bacterium]|nr:cytochrome P450 [Pseudomonadales bacterium]